MKKPLHHLLLLALATTAVSHAQEPAPAPEPASMESVFREALFAEEVDRDLTSARKKYEEVSRQFEASKEMAAAAVYRLGEVFRKLAAENPGAGYDGQAIQQYEKVIRDFPGMETLDKLSRDALAAMGRTPDERMVVGGLSEEQEWIRQLKKWKETSPDKLTEMPTPLLQAAVKNELSVADYLIETKVDLERGDGSMTPLSAAAAEGNLAMVEKLLDAGANPRPERGIPPIHNALRHDRMAVVEMLIDIGAHLDVTDNKGNPPLQILANKSLTKLPIPRQLEYARLLLESGAPVDEVNSLTGDTALILATQKQFPAMVDLLLEKHADVNAPQEEKARTTPLILACLYGDMPLAKRLIEAGAGVNQVDEFGIAPLHYALNRGPTLEGIALLIESGADVNQRIGGKDGWTPLHVWAASKPNDEIGRILCQAGANPIAKAKGVPRVLNFQNLSFGEPGTPFSLLERARGSGSTIIREFYEYGLKTIEPQDFADSVWFMMPQRPNQKPDPRSENSPANDLLPNLFPVFDQSENEETASPPPSLASLIVQVFQERAREQATPRLDQVRILRPAPDGAKWQTIEVPYEKIIASGDVKEDFELRWGDVVLFDHASNSNGQWFELGEATSWKSRSVDTSADSFAPTRSVTIGSFAPYLRNAASVSISLTLGDVSDHVFIVLPKLFSDRRRRPEGPQPELTIVNNFAGFSRSRPAPICLLLTVPVR